MEGIEYDVEEEEVPAAIEEVAITIQDSVQEAQSNIEDDFFNHNADGSNVSIPHVEEQAAP